MDRSPSTPRREADRAAMGARAALLAVLMMLLAPPADGTPGAQEPATFAAARRAAEQAHLAHQIPREHELLLLALRLGGPPEEMAWTERRVALLEWRYGARPEVARERLRRVTSGPAAAEAWLALARLELAAQQFAASRAAADRALFAADTLQLQTAAQLARSEALVAEAVAARRQGEAGNIEQVSTSIPTLVTISASRPGSLHEARLLLQAGLLTDRGDVARAALDDYYHLGPGSAAPSAIGDAIHDLRRLLPKLPPPAPEQLVEALRGARLVAEAELVALDPRHAEAVANQPRVRELLVYAAAVHQLRREVEEYYRLLSLGPTDSTALTDATRAAAMRVWDEIHGEDAPPPADDEELWRLLEQRFGVFVRLARTPPRFDLHMGYSLIDEIRVVEQYGRTAELRFVLVDNMVSQGFTDWAWEGRTGTRSYASPTAIYQIRSAQVPDTLFAWQAVSDPRLRGSIERRMREESQRDDGRARVDPTGYLPGLSMRLLHQGRIALYDELVQRGLAGDELRTSFIGEYGSAVREASVIAHEGRHALDLRDSARYRREVAAKLSEVAFAPRPRLALTAIFDSTIGTATPHGRANSSIMEGLYAWMDTYRAEVAGFDPARPLLPQFDLLTDEQIREAFRSLDPYLAMQRESR